MRRYEDLSVDMQKRLESKVLNKAFLLQEEIGEKAIIFKSSLTWEVVVKVDKGEIRFFEGHYQGICWKYAIVLVCGEIAYDYL